jgi:hypothetical protein
MVAPAELSPHFPDDFFHSGMQFAPNHRKTRPDGQVVRIANIPSLDRFHAKPKWEMSAGRLANQFLSTPRQRRNEDARS